MFKIGVVWDCFGKLYIILVVEFWSFGNLVKCIVGSLCRILLY